MQQTVNRVTCRPVAPCPVIGCGIFVTRLDERRPDGQREEGKDQ
jgi:hypothetical protein